MLKLIISALIFIPAVLSGLGLFAPAWLLISAVLAYARAIITTSDSTGAGDYQSQSDKAFMRSTKLVTVMTLIQLAMMAALYWIGRVFA